VILKPSPPDIQELYLKSLAAIGVDSALHDIRFVEDDWESRRSRLGLGWECWCDGMEVSQFIISSRSLASNARRSPAELTYGLERLAMYVQGVDRVYDLNFNGRDGAERVSYGDVFCKPSRNIRGTISNSPMPICCSSNSPWPRKPAKGISMQGGRTASARPI